MDLLQAQPRQTRQRSLVFLGALTLLLVISAMGVPGQQGRLDVLRIGATEGLNEGKSSKAGKSNIETLRTFIKDETGLANEITEKYDWRNLADQLTKGKLHLGVFQGYEFAWAQEKYPSLKPLVLAINVYRYPVAYVVTSKENQAKKFADLQGQTLVIPAKSSPFLRQFVERECQIAGKKLETFFAKVTTPEHLESALDDIVDMGTQTAIVVDRAGLEAFKQRKAGRFKKLKEVAHSIPVLPPIIAYAGNYLDDADRNRFKEGLLGADKSEKGQTMLTLFRLTGFEVPSTDFEKVVSDTRKNYPPTNNKEK